MDAKLIASGLVGLCILAIIVIDVVIPTVNGAVTDNSYSPGGTDLGDHWCNTTRCDSTWTHRTEFNSTPPAGSAPGAGYADHENITYQAGMKTDFSDLRTTWYNDSSGAEENIDHWVENYSAGNWAYVHFESPVSFDNTSPQLFGYYWGNPAATSLSNGSDTFVFFDDFNDGAIDPAKWTAYTSYDDCEESGGVLFSPGDNTSNCFLLSAYDDQTHYRIITAGKVSSNYSQWVEYMFRQKAEDVSPYMERSYSFELMSYARIWNNTVASFHQDVLDQTALPTAGYHRWYINIFGTEYDVYQDYSDTAFLNGTDDTNYNKSSSIWLSGCWSGLPD